MRFKSLLLLGMISISSTSYAASTQTGLSDTTPSTTADPTYSKAILHRYENEPKLRDIIMDNLFQTSKRTLEESGQQKHVGLICAFNKATEHFLLTAGSMILERANGTYLGLGSGDGYFEDLLRILCPELANWHTVVTDGSEANVKKINHANETFALDVNQLEDSMLSGQLQGKTFDIISIQNVFHFLSENERIKCLKCLSKLLNPNGVILLSYEKNSSQRIPLEMFRAATGDVEKLSAGVYAYNYLAATNFVKLEQSSKRKPLLGFSELLSAEPIIKQHLAGALSPDDISVQDAIVIKRDGDINVHLHRGEYTEEMKTNSEIFEFAIVYRDINFGQFPELEVLHTIDGLRYNSLVGTLMSNILIMERISCSGSLMRVFYNRAIEEKAFDAVGVCQILRKKQS